MCNKHQKMRDKDASHRVVRQGCVTGFCRKGVQPGIMSLGLQCADFADVSIPSAVPGALSY
jgi:hypothetical protein